MVFENIVLDEYAKSKLKKMYDSCSEICKSKTDNLLVDLISNNNNHRSSILRESALPSRFIDAQTRNALIDQGLITRINNSEDLIITARGILYIESLKDDNYVSILADAIQSKYFDIFNIKPPTLRDRTILLTTVAMRCFSNKSAIDFRKSEGTREIWWSIIQDISELMVKIGLIEESESLKNYKSKSDVEDPVSNIIRHSDTLPRQTNDIFSKSGKNQYWIDVAPSGEIDLEKLALIIRIIFGNALSKDNYIKYANECNKLCLLRGSDIKSSLDDSRFISMEYDSTIKRAFEKATYLNIS